MKIIVILIAFSLILGSLVCAFIFLRRDSSKTGRMVYALTYRIGFSVLLFVLLLVLYKWGVIQPGSIHQ